MSIFDRVSTLVKAQANQGLDQMEDRNAIPVLEEQIRESKDNLQKAMDMEAQVMADQARFQRDVTQAQAQVQALTNRLQTAVTQNAPPEVQMGYMKQLADAKAKLADSQSQLDSVSQELDQIKQRIDDAHTKETEAVSHLDHLKALDHAASAKEQEVSTFKKLDNVLGEGPNVNADSVAERLQHRADVADAKLGLELTSNVDPTMKATKDFELQQQLEEFKAQMGASSAPAPA